MRKINLGFAVTPKRLAGCFAAQVAACVPDINVSTCYVANITLFVTVHVIPMGCNKSHLKFVLKDGSFIS